MESFFVSSCTFPGSPDRFPGPPGTPDTFPGHIGPFPWTSFDGNIDILPPDLGLNYRYFHQKKSRKWTNIHVPTFLTSLINFNQVGCKIAIQEERSSSSSESVTSCSWKDHWLRYRTCWVPGQIPGKEHGTPTLLVEWVVVIVAW